MKKVLFAAVAFAAMIASADSYLYWMIGDTKWYGSDDSGAYAKVRAFKEGTADQYLNLYYSGGGDAVQSVLITDAKADQDYGVGMYADLASYIGDAYSYVVELYSSGGTFLADSQGGALAYSSAGNYIVQGDTMDIPAGGAWTASNYDLPEPTSGMMVLLGMAALALRRRRRA